MNAFVGLVRLDESQISGNIEDRIASGLVGRRTSAATISRSPHGLIAQETRSKTYGGFTFQPKPHGTERFLFAAAARLDNREELGTEFGIDRLELAQFSDAKLIMHAFESARRRCIG